jgi:glycosyltransferase involved in cell wall biosynthesis
MLDLIIPVYKNKKGLYRSLMSLGSELNKQVRVTIVDDCSGDNYDDVINIF